MQLAPLARAVPNPGSQRRNCAKMRQNTLCTKSAERPLLAWASVLRAGGVTLNPVMARRLPRSQSQTSLRLKACASCTNTISARWLYTE
jgi:hypothetical protein